MWPGRRRVCSKKAGELGVSTALLDQVYSHRNLCVHPPGGRGGGPGKTAGSGGGRENNSKWCPGRFFFTAKTDIKFMGPNGQLTENILNCKYIIAKWGYQIPSWE